MKSVRLSKVIATFCMLISATVAHAQSVTDIADAANSSSIELAAPEELVSARPRTDYIWTEPQPQTASAISNIMYLNNCLPNGCSIQPGGNDSRTNSSSIVRSQGRLAAWSYSPQTWAAVVQCVKETFSPFNIKIVDVDPGNVRHMEVMVSGRPTDIGFSNGIGGVAPYTCGYIENSVSFAFAAVYGGDVDEICATTAQEVAHTWGLDHEAEASDPMTYFPYNGRRRFKDANVPCGSDCQGGQGPRGESCSGANQQIRTCSCTGSPTQNSVRDIKGIFGGSTPMPPVVTFTSPRNGDKVQDEAPVRVKVVAELGLSKAELRVDGALYKTLTTQPFAFNLPPALAAGSHKVEVTVYNVFDLPGKSSIDVIAAGPCDSADDCGADQTCVNKRCVAGPGSPGGLGESCGGSADCASGNCSDDGVEKHCVESCALDQAGICPAGFDCLDTGGRGVCWPNGESTDPDDTCGNCSSSGDASVPMIFGMLVVGLAFTRRRRIDQ
jgi:MYXO-CTERM domain-containing protein